MPHYINGQEVKRGDIVNLRCKVHSVYEGEDGLNVSVAGIDGPDGEYKPNFLANSRSFSYADEVLDAPETPPGPSPSVDDE